MSASPGAGCPSPQILSVSSPYGQLPPIGLEIPCSGYAIDVPLQVAVLGVVNLGFKGGIKFRVEANLGTGMGGVKLEIIGEEYSADSPVLGKVTLSQLTRLRRPRRIAKISWQTVKIICQRTPVRPGPARRPGVRWGHGHPRPGPGRQPARPPLTTTQT